MFDQTMEEGSTYGSALFHRSFAGADNTDLLPRVVKGSKVSQYIVHLPSPPPPQNTTQIVILQLDRPKGTC